MKNLIETEEFIKAAKLNRFGGNGTARILMMVLRINKINKLYSDISHLEGIEFVDRLIDELKISFEVSEEELNRIPKTGAFITVSNHPFGGIDGLLLLKVISMVRPDFKVLANFLMQKVEPVKDYILPVNPFENRKDVKSSVLGIKYALQHLKDGYPLGVFPAGEVSSYNQLTAGIADKEWQSSAIRMIKKAEVPIVPVYFQGSNSRIFHLLGLIHPNLRTVRLPYELFNKKKKVLRIRIGNPVTVKDQKDFPDAARFGRFLRAKTYSLGSAFEVKKFFYPNLFRSNRVEDIIPPVDPLKIEQEVNQIREQYLLFESAEFHVFCTPSFCIPSIMNELGRLRELTFRQIGEGTNRSIDIDEFDLYYNQLFIWDDLNKKIVGAYRVGMGKDIMRQYGIKGFYIQSLFKINRKIFPALEQSLELGRSFIVSDYQKKPMPLFMLWKGILYFLLKHPDYRYLVGPVSISNRFSNFSKGMIIKYIMLNHYNHEIGKYIKPRTRFVPSGFDNIDIDILMESSNDLNKFDKFIKDVDTSNYTMPVLLKKYLKLNGKIVGFNIDPKFNNALDGLLFLDLFDVPIETISNLSKEINDDSILGRFNTAEIPESKISTQV
ncbi:MAG: GNAT family N-acetyltransferase [Bacteroidales bacterium]|nr:GNAT family N-acetyltransferase [Bacteroidales bacterium]MCB8999287.1 GNAT family N-acetyltransferase [Bacteroidales bacterium]MCB9013043.1 GNAT family N-acetyltransferase [Bacteroidales bacterium]